MSGLKYSLDLSNSNEIIIKNNIKKDKKTMCKLLDSINKNYLLSNTDPIINTILNQSYIPRKLIINKEKIIINKKINSLQNLLDLINEFPIVCIFPE